MTKKEEAEKRRKNIAAIRTEFPKHGKEAYSFASRSSETGVMFCPRAIELIGGETPITAKKEEHRKNPCRWNVRLSKAQSDVLNRRMERLGYSTKQTFLEVILKREADKELRYESVLPIVESERQNLTNPK